MHSRHPFFNQKNTIASAALSFAMLSCSSASAWQPKLLREEPIQKTQKISSEWEQGGCSLEGNILTYSYKQKSRAIVLDSPVIEPKNLICTEDYTVIMAKEHAIVARGAYRILMGAEALGSLGSTAPLNNSFALPIVKPAAEGIISSRLNGQTLEIQTNAGKIWSMDLENPVKWNIYMITRDKGKKKS